MGEEMETLGVKPGGLAEWFGKFWERWEPTSGRKYPRTRRQRSTRRRVWEKIGVRISGRKEVVAKGMCRECAKNPIATGVSHPSEMARENEMCLACYRKVRSRETMRAKYFQQVGICQRCKSAGVAQGRAILKAKARAAGMCSKCFKESRE
jgi:hypothetical protein